MRRKYGYFLYPVIDRDSDGYAFIRDDTCDIESLEDKVVWNAASTIYSSMLIARIARKRFEQVYQNKIKNGL